MPQYTRKQNDIFRSMFDIDIPGYVPEMTRGDSIKTGLLPRARTPTASEEALNRLVDTGLITSDKRDSITGGLLKFPTPRVPSEKEIGIGGLLGAGEITPFQADSMRAGLEIGKEPTKFGVAPWELSPDWINTPEGKDAFKKRLRGSITEQLNLLTSIMAITSVSEFLGGIEDEPLRDEATRKLLDLLARETGIITKTDTLKEWFEQR